MVPSRRISWLAAAATATQPSHAGTALYRDDTSATARSITASGRVAIVNTAFIVAISAGGLPPQVPWPDRLAGLRHMLMPVEVMPAPKATAFRTVAEPPS
jgi:hypothetical protein